MNKLITSTEIETVIKSPTNKTPIPYGFTGKFCQTFREEVTQFFLKLPKKKYGKEETFSSSFYEPTFILIPKLKTSHTQKKKNTGQ